MLLKENETDLSTAIHLGELPRTFVDAVEITRRFEIAYIWIDALCIIQDDDEDWRREAGLMQYVYEGSFLNIAASSATSVHGGCWLKHTNVPDGMRARVIVNDEQIVREFVDRRCYNSSVWGSHLATRAWALQEKLLPPRTVHLGDRGAFWECRARIASQFLPEGFKLPLMRGLLRMWTIEDHPQNWWQLVVRYYTNADLTYTRDKLLALAGVARKVHSRNGCQYLAGLWRDDRVEAQLCWSCGEPKKRPTEWRAPTWSWASIDGPISYMAVQEGIFDDRYAHVTDATISPLGEDPFGQLLDGVLRITCMGMLIGRFDERHTMFVQFGEGLFSVRVFLDHSDEDYLAGGITNYLLPLVGGGDGSATLQDDEWVDSMAVRGILLRATDGTVGQFHRIGAFECGSREVGEQYEANNEDYHAFMRIFEGSRRQSTAPICAEVIRNEDHPQEQYVITLI